MVWSTFLGSRRCRGGPGGPGFALWGWPRWGRWLWGTRATTVATGSLVGLVYGFGLGFWRNVDVEGEGVDGQG